MKFQVEQRNDCRWVKCDALLTSGLVTELLAAILSLKGQPLKSIVLDLQNKVEVDPAARIELRKLAARFDSKGIKIFVHAPPQKSRVLFETPEMKPLFPLVENDGLKISSESPLLESERELCKAISEGVNQATELMTCGRKVQAGDPFLPGPLAHFDYAVVASLGIQGKRFVGRLYLAFSEAVYLEIASALNGRPMTRIEADSSDIGVEIVNMVRGLMRERVRGYVIEAGVPKREDLLSTTQNMKQHEAVLAIAFSFGEGKFHALLGMDQPKSD